MLVKVKPLDANGFPTLVVAALPFPAWHPNLNPESNSNVNNNKKVTPLDHGCDNLWVKLHLFDSMG